jgi:hypothetical protein
VIRIALWVIACGLLLFSAIATVGNAGIVLRWLISRKTSSLAPFLGGLCGVLGVLAMPVRGAAKWCLIPFVLDLGSAFMLLGVVWMLLRRKRTEYGEQHDAHEAENAKARPAPAVANQVSARRIIVLESRAIQAA